MKKLIGIIFMIVFVLSVSAQGKRDYEGHATGDNPPGSNNGMVDSTNTDNGQRKDFVGGVQLVPDFPDTAQADFEEAIKSTDAYKAIYEPWKLLGSDVVAIPYGCPMNPNTFANITATQNVTYGAMYKLLDTITVTGVRTMQGTQGVYTAQKYNGFSLYRLGNDTVICVDSTTNDGDIWKGSAGSSIAKAWANGAHVLAPGIYYVHTTFNSSGAPSTAPTLLAHSVTYSGFNALYNLVTLGEGKMRTLITGTNYPAASYPISAYTSSAFAIHAVLYYTAP